MGRAGGLREAAKRSRHRCLLLLLAGAKGKGPDHRGCRGVRRRVRRGVERGRIGSGCGSDYDHCVLEPRSAFEENGFEELLVD